MFFIDRLFVLSLAICLFTTAVNLHAQSPNESAMVTGEEKQPVPNVISNKFLKAMVNHKTAFGYTKQVKVQGQPFSHALRSTVTQKPTRNPAFQVGVTNSLPVAKGDVLLASFYMRTLESTDDTGEGRVKFLFEKNGSPWNRSADIIVNAGPKWQKISLPFASAENYKPGKVRAIFRFSFKPQVIELADLKIVNFKKTKTVAQLPGMRRSYVGREPNASWRIEAAKRIDQYRKSNLHVTVVDAKGQPVANVPVTVQMKQHAFGFGAAVKAKHFLPNANKQADVNLRNEVKKLYNTITFENDLKAKKYSSQRMQTVMQAIDWFDANNIWVRGHVLVWPSFRNHPKLKQYKDDPVKLSASIDDYITMMLKQTAGRIPEWDVVNEPRNHHGILDVLGSQAMGHWFKQARKADSNARLYLNETSVPVVMPGSKIYDTFYDHIQQVIHSGAPIDGIGMQGHVGWSMNSPTDLWKIFDRFASFGLPIRITEFDIGITDEQLQADYTRDFYIACFAHPSLAGITIWGLWEGEKGHLPEGAFFRKDWSAKPAQKELEKLIKEKWWTHQTLSTNHQGEMNLRAFQGQYDIVATIEGKQITKEIFLGKQNCKLTIELK